MGVVGIDSGAVVQPRFHPLSPQHCFPLLPLQAEAIARELEAAYASLQPPPDSYWDEPAADEDGGAAGGEAAGAAEAGALEQQAAAEDEATAEPQAAAVQDPEPVPETHSEL